MNGFRDDDRRRLHLPPRSVGALLLLAAAVSTPAVAQEGASPRPNANAETSLSPDQRIEAQAAELAELREKLTTVVTTQEMLLAREGADRPPAVGARVPGLTLSGYAQVDFTMRQGSVDQLDSSTGEPLNEKRFLVRRARLRADLDRQWVAGAVELDGNTVKGIQARLVAAEATLRLPPPPGGLPLVALTAGLIKVPFGSELAESDRERLFVERSQTARALFPGEYDVGAKITGAWRFMRWSAALQNGNPASDRTFPGRDPNAAKDLTLRAGVDTVAGPAAIVGGVSYLKGKGFHKGANATKDSVVWRDANENGFIDTGEISVVAGRSATPSSNFDRSVFGADLRLTFRLLGLGPTRIAGEIAMAKNLDRGLLPADPISSSRDLRELGYYVSATQDLGEHFQVGVRYDRYDPDRDATDSRVGKVVPADASYSTLAFAAAFRLPSARLLLEYDLNRNHLGRNRSGVPANQKDNLFTARLEASF